MQDLYKWGKWALIVLTVFLGIHTLGAVKGLSNINPAYNSISVSGEGEIVSVPDIAEIHFSVSADAAQVEAAQGRVTEKMDAIVAALKNLGIEEKDIKTTNYSVWPKYRYEAAIYPAPGRQIPDGYTANHDVDVKVRKIDDAGKVLALLGENGATNISNIMFAVDDYEKVYQEARMLAIKDAREKAKSLADELDVRLVRVVSYSDSNGGYPTPIYNEAYGMGGDMVKASAAPALPTGENKTKVTVTVTYEIR